MDGPRSAAIDEWLDADTPKDVSFSHLGLLFVAVMGHSYQLEQILLNILDNARDTLDDLDTKPEYQKTIHVRTGYNEQGVVPKCRTMALEYRMKYACVCSSLSIQQAG